VKLTDTPCRAPLAKNPAGWTYQTATVVDGESVPNVGEVAQIAEAIAAAAGVV